jgi:hypothetical protein
VADDIVGFDADRERLVALPGIRIYFVAGNNLIND